MWPSCKITHQVRHRNVESNGCPGVPFTGRNSEPPPQVTVPKMGYQPMQALISSQPARSTNAVPSKLETVPRALTHGMRQKDCSLQGHTILDDAPRLHINSEQRGCAGHTSCMPSPELLRATQVTTLHLSGLPSTVQTGADLQPYVPSEGLLFLRVKRVGDRNIGFAEYESSTTAAAALRWFHMVRIADTIIRSMSPPNQPKELSVDDSVVRAPVTSDSSIPSVKGRPASSGPRMHMGASHMFPLNYHEFTHRRMKVESMLPLFGNCVLLKAHWARAISTSRVAEARNRPSFEGADDVVSGAIRIVANVTGTYTVDRTCLPKVGPYWSASSLTGVCSHSSTHGLPTSSREHVFPAVDTPLPTSSSHLVTRSPPMGYAPSEHALYRERPLMSTVPEAPPFLASSEDAIYSSDRHAANHEPQCPPMDVCCTQAIREALEEQLLPSKTIFVKLLRNLSSAPLLDPCGCVSSYDSTGIKHRGEQQSLREGSFCTYGSSQPGGASSIHSFRSIPIASYWEPCTTPQQPSDTDVSGGKQQSVTANHSYSTASTPHLQRSPHPSAAWLPLIQEQMQPSPTYGPSATQVDPNVDTTGKTGFSGPGNCNMRYYTSKEVAMALELRLATHVFDWRYFCCFEGYSGYRGFGNPPFHGGCFVRFQRAKYARKCLENLRRRRDFEHLFSVEFAKHDSL